MMAAATGAGAARSAVAQVFHGAGARPRFTIRHVPLPSPRRGEILVAVEVATICGSDLHTIDGHRQEPVPLVLGHEGVGRVVELGQDLDGAAVRVGDRVTWSIADSCGRCPMCTRYRLPQKCDSLFKYGHADMQSGSGLNGTYASHVLLRSGTELVRVPDAVPSRLAAPVNCALATVVNILDGPEVAACQSAVVQGGGLLGIYAIAVLRSRGVSPVFCMDRHTNRLKLATEFGAIALPSGDDAVNERLRLVKSQAPRGVDLVVEVAGTAPVLPEGVSMLRVGGTYAIAGLVHPDSRLDQLTAEQLIRKCLTLRGHHNYAPSHLKDAMRFLESNLDKYPFEKLVSKPFALSELEQAIDEARSHSWCRVSVVP